RSRLAADVRVYDGTYICSIGGKWQTEGTSCRVNNERLSGMLSPSSDHKALVRHEFTQQAQAYAANSSIADHSRLIRLVQAVHPQPKAHVLDVATGPGYVAMTFAQAGCEVVGLDLTEA